MAGEWSNLKEVARTSIVHYMTAYRYVRQGRLPATWVDNCWQVHRDDLAEFVASPGRTLDQAPVDQRLRFALHLVNGDEPGAWSVIESALAAGVDARGCYLGVLSAALRAAGRGLGDRHRRRPRRPAPGHRHRARIVHRLGALVTRPGRRKGSIVLGSPIGERHTLPVAIAADLIRLAGFTVLEPGPMSRRDVRCRRSSAPNGSSPSASA